MSKIYSIDNTKDKSIRECRPFDTQENEIVKEYSSTYNDVLAILKEAFKMVDLKKILGR